MRRLRLTDDQGGVAVLYALSMLVIFGFIGLSIDVGAAFAKRQEAQNAADAAAIAVAAECLEVGLTAGCPGDYTAAREIALDNERTRTTMDVLAGDIQYSTPAPYHLRVTTTGAHEPWFLPAVTDLPLLTVKRSATVNFGSPIAGTTLPVLFSECLFPGGEEGAAPPFGTPIEMWLPKGNFDPGDEDCSTGSYPSGGFGWIEDSDQPTVECSLHVDLAQPIESKPGISLPTGCSNVDIASLIGSVVLVPLFDFSEYSGSGGEYTGTRFAAVKLVGYSPQTGNFNPVPPPPSCLGTQPDWASKACFRFEFQEFITDPGDFDLGGPITELTAIRLTE